MECRGGDGSSGEWNADQGFVPVYDADVGFMESIGREEEDQQLDEGGPHRGRRRRRSRLSLTRRGHSYL